MAMGSVPAYDATYALSHALRTASEGGTASKPIEVTQTLSGFHGGGIVPASSVPAVKAAGVTPSAPPLPYRVESKGKTK